MMQTLKTLLVAACLICLSPVLAASDGDVDGDVAVAKPRYVTDDEKGKLVCQAFLGVCGGMTLLRFHFWLYLI